MSDSPARWRKVRDHLNGNRHALTRAAALRYPGLGRAGSTHLLTRPGWLPDDPLPFGDVRPVWHDDVPPSPVTGAETPARPFLPEGSVTYARAMAAHGRPKLFENRVCYRLLDVAWPRLDLGRGHYFDAVDVGEAAAHELARAGLLGLGEGALPFRTLVGDPTNLAGRPTLPAVSVLTLRRDSRTGKATFVLHWRDPARVAHAGGLYQVMPVGVFQPVRAESEAADLDLWRCVVREYAEEFLGLPELYGAAFDHDSWPFHLRMEQARAEGAVRPLVLGLGVDPLTFATDVLAVTVFEAEAFDDLLGAVVETNEEGRVVGTAIPFDAAHVARYVNEEPTQAAGAAVLELAWRHRHALLP
ncbi:hypothetical protein [Streptosporangium saharense]|uniref:hypothetical protein n=1 Tax=Streptosporangium saharense TaxID=1706840 RepID=UPI00332E434E